MSSLRNTLENLSKSESEIIHAPLVDVFTYVSDLTHYPQWSYWSYRDCEKISTSAIGISSRFRLTGMQGIQAVPLMIEVTSFIPWESIGFVVNHPVGYYLDASFMVESLGESTKLTETSSVFRLPKQWNFLRYLINVLWMSPWALPGRSEEVRKEIRRIKEIIETTKVSKDRSM